MTKIAYVDIGELGWSLYISAHLRWMKKYTKCSLAIMTSFDRKCLYRDSADLILNVPCDFYEKFPETPVCFGVHPFRSKELRKYFLEMLPSGHIIPEKFNFNCDRKFLGNKVIYKSYEYSKKLEGKKKILVFPRHREQPGVGVQNVPRLFYVTLIKKLCDEFPNYEIKTRGINSGSYIIWNDEIKKNNYMNGVKENADLQDTIDDCQLAKVAIGGQSSLPKIALLQGTPTFMIGHQKDKHAIEENWMNTRAGFYEVKRTSYADFDFKDCISKIMIFIKECKRTGGLNGDKR